MQTIFSSLYKINNRNMADLSRKLHQHATIHVHTLLILLFTMLSPTVAANTTYRPWYGDQSSADRQALLSFKSQLSSDPRGTLASWTNASTDFCTWHGVTCSKKQTPARVIALELPSSGLIGQIPPGIANLSFIRAIDLSHNQLGGAIPQEIGRLTRLRQLNLSVNLLSSEIPSTLSSCSRLEELVLWQNSLAGEIPSNLSRCSRLRFIHFSSNKLHGSIPPGLGALPALSELILSGNSLVGSIPESLGGETSSLTYVNLGQNYLTGGIPRNLARSRSLKALVLPFNGLNGNVPPELFNGSSLSVIDLTRNNFTGYIPSVNTMSLPLSSLSLTENSFLGSIPPSIGNLSSLSELFLDSNYLVGEIPDSLGLLKLEMLDIGMNSLSGSVPYSIYNMSSLTFLHIGNNSFTGEISHDIGFQLPYISTLVLQGNKFEGLVPASLANATSLEILDLGVNSFHGLIPSLGSLSSLSELDLGANRFEIQDWASLSFLSNCSKLTKLLLDDNIFNGSLQSIANLSIQMEWLWLSGNQFSGSIPSDLGNLKNLTVLFLDQNQLTGSIPSTIGDLRNLGSLSLARNKLTGSIPNSIGNLDRLEELYLDKNQLEGTIPPSLEGCRNLLILNLSSNNLHGIIPLELLRMSSLSRGLDLSCNRISGLIPSQVGSLINLGQLFLSRNQLTGKIPYSLGQCVLLQSLELDGNFLDGNIPESFRNLKGIQKMDLSQNNLSGTIPDFFKSYTSLQYLNISFNDFNGPVPMGRPFNVASEVYLQGNKRLCTLNMMPGLPDCSTLNSSARNASYILKIVLPLGVVSLFLLSFILWFFYIKRRGQSQKVFIKDRRPRKVSYADLVKATNQFSSDNLVGTGQFGTVYKGVLDLAVLPVAVKVFNLDQHGALRSFLDECKVLRRIRHRNLVKVITLCSTMDYTGKEFKALIFEYMPNGNLDKWIHPMMHQQRPLSLVQRINVAMDVAYALDYLHRLCIPPLVHCDLKPSNVLLDYDMIAHVGDFGLAKSLNVNSLQHINSSTLSGFKGSIGYIAPEYGMGIKNTIGGDVYSYGVLLLEMLTGKRPTDEIFQDGFNLHHYVYAAFPGNIKEILDPSLLQEVCGTSSVNTEEENRAETWINSCITPLIKVGLLCSMESPRQRMMMGDVCNVVARAKEIYSMSLHSEEPSGY